MTIEKGLVFVDVLSFPFTHSTSFGTLGFGETISAATELFSRV